MDELDKQRDTSVTMDKIFALEEVMRQMPQADFKVTHHFSKGVYARELFIPAGTTLTGKIHKHTNLNIMTQGEMSVSTEDGVQHVKAPFIVVSPPGTKRVAFAHTDCVWITIHGTDETDLAKIEQEFVTESYEDYLQFRANLILKGD